MPDILDKVCLVCKPKPFIFHIIFIGKKIAKFSFLKSSISLCLSGKLCYHLDCTILH